MRLWCDPGHRILLLGVRVPRVGMMSANEWMGGGGREVNQIGAKDKMIVYQHDVSV